MLAQLGFEGDALPVNDALRSSLGVDTGAAGVEIVAGRGALRACAIELRDGADAAAVVSQLARYLAHGAAHALWLVAAVQRQPASLAIAVPSGDASAVSTFLVDRARVVDSDAETLCLLASMPAANSLDLVIHTRWTELLGREALNRRFYRALERQVRTLADGARGGRPADRAQVALLCSSRLLFLAFLQCKGWLDGDHGFLQRVYDECVAGRGGVHQRMLRPLFFGTLNTPLRKRAPAARAFGRVPFLNGGLFAPMRVERGAQAPILGDAGLGEFLREVLGRYRFTASEERTTATGTAVDPEMLGRAFESLMASRERRASGTFYTPSSFVGRVADGGLLLGLRALLPGHARPAVDALARGEAPASSLQAPTRTALRQLTVLDPACGSGAFLVHALERLASWRVLAGDGRTTDLIRRELLAGSIFGIDRDPTAVWLCELRLWLAVAVECEEADPLRVQPLPNLDRNIRVGDALGPLGGELPNATSGDRARDGERFAVLRARYATASGPRKERAAAALDSAERTMSVASIDREHAYVRARRRDVIAARRSPDLFGRRSLDAVLERESIVLRDRAGALRRERRRLAEGGALPFRFDAHFADVSAAGGFGAVIGNPPWVRLHRIPMPERAALRARFSSLRDAAWAAGAAEAGAGSGFAGQADLAALFIERALDLLQLHGTLALLVPAKLWSTLAGGGIRHLLATRARLHAVEDCTDAPDLFEAVTYPSIVIAERAARVGSPARLRTEGATVAAQQDDRTANACTAVAVHRGARTVRWHARSADLAFDTTPGSPWLLLPPLVRVAFDRVHAAGTPAHSAGFSRPIMGVKSGLNDAFIVTLDGTLETVPEGHVTRVVDRAGRRGTVESAMLRRIIRGEHVRPWRLATSDERIIWTHDSTGPVRSLPDHAARWLMPQRARLRARSDIRGRAPWWSLHRTEGAEEHGARVVWADMARSPRAAWLAPGDDAVPLNTCYILKCPSLVDAQAFAALFNSPLASAWLRCLAEPARGGYRRMFAWTAALFPVPRDWPRARRILSPLAVRAQQARAGSEIPGAVELLDAALDAYCLSRRSVTALFDWNPDSSW